MRWVGFTLRVAFPLLVNNGKDLGQFASPDSVGELDAIMRAWRLGFDFGEVVSVRRVVLGRDFVTRGGVSICNLVKCGLGARFGCVASGGGSGFEISMSRV